MNALKMREGLAGVIRAGVLMVTVGLGLLPASGAEDVKNPKKDDFMQTLRSRLTHLEARRQASVGADDLLKDCFDMEGRDGARIVTSGAYMAGDSIRLELCRNIGLRN